jgi:alpha-beta hydrolase superfamily lysophospholipase
MSSEDQVAATSAEPGDASLSVQVAIDVSPIDPLGVQVETPHFGGPQNTLSPADKWFTNADDDHMIMYRTFSPSDGSDPVAVMFIIHGISEHSGRYAEFAQESADALRIQVVVHDQMGHGYTACPVGASDISSLGKLPERKLEHSDIVTVMAADLIALINGVNERKLPVILFGHSMGSVVTRCALHIAKDDFIDSVIGVVLHGLPTAPGFIEMRAFYLLGWFIKKTGRGSEFVQETLVLGKFDGQLKSKLKQKDLPKHSFLSSDLSQIQNYSDSPFAGHLVDVDLLLSVGKNLRGLLCPERYFSSIKNRKLDFLFMSGMDDPVCEFGATASSDASKMASQGHRVTELKLYGSRHEFINEVTPVRLRAINQMHAWIANRMKECKLI